MTQELETKGLAKLEDEDYGEERKCLLCSTTKSNLHTAQVELRGGGTLMLGMGGLFCYSCREVIKTRVAHLFDKPYETRADGKTS